MVDGACAAYFRPGVVKTARRCIVLTANARCPRQAQRSDWQLDLEHDVAILFPLSRLEVRPLLRERTRQQWGRGCGDRGHDGSPEAVEEARDYLE